MQRKERIAREIMMEFADRTGLSNPAHPPRRYLWTDAFAVCNFLGLYRRTGDEAHRRYALDLVDQVHNVLGRHREGGAHKGWISGLGEEEGRRHPTRGGLRIGKTLDERQPDQPFDERLEWERDGQYFHYLTKWMHALCRVSQVTGDPTYNRWAIELAKTAHAAFTYISPVNGQRHMYWKMSIDLSRPLVPSMGQHDALDAFVTYQELAATARDLDDDQSEPLNRETDEALDMLRRSTLATSDPLGIGGLLNDACFIFQLVIQTPDPRLAEWLPELGHAALKGLSLYVGSDALQYPPHYRLAFRELGVSIGLHGLELMKKAIEADTQLSNTISEWGALYTRLATYLPLAEQIETYWLMPAHQSSDTWREHLDINSVMLGTSLLPDGFLLLHASAYRPG